MQVVYDRCCGLDIHKKLIVACVLSRTPQGVQKEIRTFSTMLSDLFRLRDWLKASDCQMVAMESTGVYKCLSKARKWIRCLNQREEVPCLQKAQHPLG
jgi:hypothetical protein